VIPAPSEHPAARESEEIVAADPSFVLENTWPHGGLYVLEACGSAWAWRKS
jgi:hypothetical protein